MHGHGAAVVVDVVAALAVGEDLDALDEAGGVVAGASGLVPSVFLTRKAILMDSRLMKDVPLVSGMRQTLEVVGEGAQRAGEVPCHAAPSRNWCCLFSACSPGSASAHPGLRR